MSANQKPAFFAVGDVRDLSRVRLKEARSKDEDPKSVEFDRYNPRKEAISSKSKVMGGG